MEEFEVVMGGVLGNILRIIIAIGIIGIVYWILIKINHKRIKKLCKKII